MSDTPRRFKVGELVTPMEVDCHEDLIYGKVYKVTKSYSYPASEDGWVVEIDGDFSMWAISHFKTAKNNIVKDIINDL